MPVPDLTKAPVPLITPAYAEGLVEPATVRVAAPSVTLPPFAPPPVKEPTCVAYPVMFKMAPEVLANVTSELLPNAPLTPATEATPAASVPAVTVVVPV